MPELETRGHASIAMDLPVEDGSATGHSPFLARPSELADALVSTLATGG